MLTKILRVRFFRKSKIEFLNPKESENRFRVSLLNRSDLSYNDESKELKNPLQKGEAIYRACEPEPRAASPQCLFASSERFPPKNPKTGVMPVTCRMLRQKLLGIPEENGTTFPIKLGQPNQEESDSYHFLFLYRIPYILSAEKYDNEHGTANFSRTGPAEK